MDTVDNRVQELEKQLVELEDRVSKMPLEHDIVMTVQEADPEDSLLYINQTPTPAQISLAENIIQEEMRKHKNQSRSVAIRKLFPETRISGYHIVLKQGHSNKLWETLSLGANDYENWPNKNGVFIDCHVLEIHGELHISAAELNISAKTIVWADRAAALNLKPPKPVGKGSLKEGSKPGKQGAVVTLAADRWLEPGRKAGDPPVIRIVADGGDGQDAPDGIDGAAGAAPLDMHGKPVTPMTQYGFPGKNNSRTPTFDPPAIRLSVHRTKSGTAWKEHHIVGKATDDDFGAPGNAIAGKPGVGAAPGMVISNLPDIESRCTMKSGNPGKKSRDYYGGCLWLEKDVNPKDKKIKSYQVASYDIRIEYGFGVNGNIEHFTTNAYKVFTLRAGRDAPAYEGVSEKRHGPLFEPLKSAMGWLNHKTAEVAVEFARNLYLAGRLDEARDLLQEYDFAFFYLYQAYEAHERIWHEHCRYNINRERLSIRAEDYWEGYNASRMEIGAMLCRINNNLDYYGNRGGFSPLLSLRGNLDIYATETKSAMKTMLLSNWITSAKRKGEIAENVLNSMISQASSDKNNALGRKTSAEKNALKLTSSLEVNRKTNSEITSRMSAVEADIRKKAEHDADIEAKVKFAGHLFAGICNVIPKGQPALGAIGSTIGSGLDAGMKLDFDPNEDIANILDSLSAGASGTGKSLKDSRKDSLEESKLYHERRKMYDNADQFAAFQKADQKALMGQGAFDMAGKALSEFAQAARSFNAPESVIQAKCNKLKESDARYKTVVADLERVLKEREQLTVQYAHAQSAIAESNATISECDRVLPLMRSSLSCRLGELNPYVVSFAKKLEERAISTLRWYLYLVVRSYESALLEPMTGVDWKLDMVQKKILEYINNDNYSVTPENLDRWVDGLQPIYDSVLSKLKTDLITKLASFARHTGPITVTVTREKHPRFFEELDENGLATIDIMDLDSMGFQQELVRIRDIGLSQVLVAPPAKGSLDFGVDIMIHDEGLVRSGSTMYVSRSENPASWSWRITTPDAKKAGGGDVMEATIGESSSTGIQMDLVNFIVGQNGEKSKAQSLFSAMPLLSKATVILQKFSGEAPKLDSLNFSFQIEWKSASTTYLPLRVRCMLREGDTEQPLNSMLIGCTSDLNGRGYGFHNMLRFYSRESTPVIELDAGYLKQDDFVFSEWVVEGASANPVEGNPRKISFSAKKAVEAICYFERRSQ